MSLIAKIKIEITYNELSATTQSFLNLSQDPLQHTKVKLSRSVLEEVIPKLLKKELSKRHDKGVFVLSLKYYEAHYLHEFLQVVNILENDHFLQCMINKLNQKLA